MPPQEPAEIGGVRPGVGKSTEDQMMDQATDRGYEYTKQRNFKSGGKVKKYANGGMSEADAERKKRMFEQSEKDDARMPPEANKAAVDEFNRRVASGDDYSVQTAYEAAQSAKAPYRIKNMREDARKSTSDILRRPIGMKKGGVVKSSVSRRADGCAVRGKTRGKMV